MKMNNRFLFGILSIALAAIIAFIGIPMANRQSNGRTEVLRITQSLHKGDQITEQNIETISVGTYNMPADTVKSADSIIGKYAATDLFSGDFILSSKLLDEQPYSEINEIPEGKLAVSLTVKTLASGVSNKLQTGDIIRIFHYRDYARDIPELLYVRVLYVTDSKGADMDSIETDEMRETAAITVVASHEQALIITGIENDGIAYVALVSRGNDELAAELLGVQDTILDEILNPPEEEFDPPEEEFDLTEQEVD